MKKYLLLIFLVFAFTGCDAVYNLEIKNDEVIESSNFYIGENYFAGSDYSIDYAPDYYDLNDAIDNIINTNYQSFTDVNSNKFYEKRVIDDSIGKGVNFKYIYNYDNYRQSTLFNYCGDKISYVNNDEIILIDVNDLLSCFLGHDINANSLKVNVRTDLKVLDNNADSIKDNIYTWNLDVSNAKEKRIYIKMRKKVTDKNYIYIIIVILIFIFLIVFSTFYIIKKKNDSNEF